MLQKEALLAVLVGPDSSFPPYAVHWYAGKVWRRPTPSVLVPGGCLSRGPQPVPGTSQVCCAFRLSRSPNSHNCPLGVLGRTSSCLLPPSCQPTPGGKGWPLALTLAELLGKNPGEPLHLPQILDPSREGFIWRKGQGSPPATPGGTCCSIPKTFFCNDPNSWSGHRPLTGLRWWTGSVALFLPSRWPQWPGPSDGLPSPQWGPFQWKCPSSPSWGFFSLEAGCQPDQVPPSCIMVHPLSAPGGLLVKTLSWQLVPQSIPAPMVGTLVASWACTLHNIGP